MTTAGIEPATFRFVSQNLNHCATAAIDSLRHPILNYLRSYFVTLHLSLFFLLSGHFKTINLLTPNVNYSGRTAPLTSKVAFYIFIQQI